MLRDKLGKELLFFDGGMGTMLQAGGLKAGELPETLNLKNPELVYSVHKAYADAGADIISFHVESDSDIKATIDKIKSFGIKPGLVIKPNTPVETVFPYLEDLYMVLVMTVEPGFGGQSFMEDMMPKVSALRAEIEKRGLKCEIEVDGGINENTISTAAKAGADVFVSGSALFSSADRKGTMEKFKKIAEENYCK